MNEEQVRAYFESRFGPEILVTVFEVSLSGSFYGGVKIVPDIKNYFYFGYISKVSTMEYAIAHSDDYFLFYTGFGPSGDWCPFICLKTGGGSTSLGYKAVQVVGYRCEVLPNNPNYVQP